MKRSNSLSFAGSEFDDFLLAPIDEDNGGMLLSVLSALARLDVDPWEEAARLAELPGETATRKLAALIAALPDGSSACPDPEAIAARLIVLLPRRVGSGFPPCPTLPGILALTKSPLITYLSVNLIFVLVMLAFQWLGASPQASAQLTSAPAASASSALVQSPPASRDQ
jgi:hypothetical protein